MTASLTVLAELRTVLDSWEKRLDFVRDECRSLEPKLRQVATDLGGGDIATGAKSDAVHTPRGPTTSSSSAVRTSGSTGRRTSGSARTTCSWAPPRMTR
ncbi:hypothetical protein [Streptomyces sp. C10-9-1]|uniref:hypothetical protein n=1 Tax=Streptomyces sp. C10-9-1 TaxID=1859285 RepID=UPI003D7159F5